MSEFVYCLNTSTIRPTPLLEKIEIAGKAGYAAIEPWNDEIDAYLEQGGTLAELKRALADAGLKVVSMIALAWVDHVRGGRARAGSRRLPAPDGPGRRAGKPLHRRQPAPGSRGPGPRHRPVRRAARDRQAGSASCPRWSFWASSMASRTSPAPGRSRRGPAIRKATVVADVFHMIRGGGSVDDLLTLEGDRLACFHINDLPAEPDPLTQKDEDRVMVGDGIADLPRVIANLRTIGYRGPLSLELFNRGCGSRTRSRWSRGGSSGFERWSRGEASSGLDRVNASAEGLLSIWRGCRVLSDLTHDLGGAVEHHLELADDRDELPAFARHV